MKSYEEITKCTPSTDDTSQQAENVAYEKAAAVNANNPISTTQNTEVHMTVSSSNTEGWISVRLIPVAPKKTIIDTDI